MTREELDRFIQSTTEPHNTGASADACRIVRMIFEHDGLLLVAVDDKENNAGFIAHLCRRVTQELKTINGQTHAARDADRLRFQRSLDAERNAQHRAEEYRVLKEAEAESEEELWPLVPYTFL